MLTTCLLMITIEDRNNNNEIIIFNGHRSRLNLLSVFNKLKTKKKNEFIEVLSTRQALEWTIDIHLNLIMTH